MKCWDANSVREFDEVRREVDAAGRTAHFGRVFPLCVEKHSELPPEQRKYKGRVVFQGNRVQDQNANYAVFDELASSASLMSAGKMLDIIGCQDGFTVEQSDAQQAYTQSELGGVETWIMLPRDQWRPGWSGKFRVPVVRLRLALYGHPLSGAYWERHCTAKLKEAGFEPIPTWESCFLHRELRLVLSVYVDDFKLAGPTQNMKEGWRRIRSVIKMDEPTPLGKYLGCGHVLESRVLAEWADVFETHSVLLKGASYSSETGETVTEREGRPSRRDGRPSLATRSKGRGVTYEMRGFMEQCVERYLDLSHTKRSALRHAPTPSLDDSTFTPEDLETKGELSDIAARVLMKVLYAARMCRYDLLYAVSSLAREVSKWTRACDKRLWRLICYINSTIDLVLVSVVGDPLSECRMLMFCDSDFAGDRRTSKSTSGLYLALVGPHTFAPIGAISKAQSAVSHSSTQSEIVALEYALRVEGLPAMDFWDAVLGAGILDPADSPVRGGVRTVMRPRAQGDPRAAARGDPRTARVSAQGDPRREARGDPRRSRDRAIGRRKSPPGPS